MLPGKRQLINVKAIFSVPVSNVKPLTIDKVELPLLSLAICFRNKYCFLLQNRINEPILLSLESHWQSVMLFEPFHLKRIINRYRNWHKCTNYGKKSAWKISAINSRILAALNSIKVHLFESLSLHFACKLICTWRVYLNVNDICWTCDNHCNFICLTWFRPAYIWGNVIYFHWKD